MTRSARISSTILVAFACVACTGPTMHVEWDRGRVPNSLRMSAVEGCTHVDVDGIPRGDAYTMPSPGPLGPPVVSVDVQFYPYDDGDDLHLRTVYLDANGRAIAQGEGQATIRNGETITVTMSPTGPQ